VLLGIARKRPSDGLWELPVSERTWVFARCRDAGAGKSGTADLESGTITILMFGPLVVVPWHPAWCSERFSKEESSIAQGAQAQRNRLLTP